MAQTAVVVSHASIVVPYFLGVVLSLVLYRELAPPGVSFLAFALFMGIAMSITAFPVLARILSERRLTGTKLGDTAITCAAVDDVTAWSLLAVVVAVVSARGFSAAVPTIVLTLAFIAAMIWLVRPLLKRLFARVGAGLPGSTIGLTGALLFLLASALTTEAIGIHALFGAFLAGAVIPREARLREALTSRLEEVTSVLLLPLFFAFTGLRTEIGLLNDGRSWLLCGLIILVATAGKLGGTLLAARLTRLSWADSFALGALMNTRGLMELIALNLGYELGILSPRVFAMMVLMALTTTLATGPLLSLADRFRPART
jgi:Kef-type K+ transport system membrane component KefB